MLAVFTQLGRDAPSDSIKERANSVDERRRVRSHLLDDGADRAAGSGAAGTLLDAGGAGWAVTLGARPPGALGLLTHTAPHWSQR